MAKAEGRIQPVAAVADTDMICLIPTTREPGRGFRRPRQGAGGPRQRAVDFARPRLSLGDVPDMFAALVYTDGDAARPRRWPRSWPPSSSGCVSSWPRPRSTSTRP